jgi:hypothetical protein
MKKVLSLTAALLLVSSLAFGKEIAEGTTELSGAANLGLQTETKDWVYQINLKLDAFYYIAPSLGIGPILGFDKTKGEGSSFSLGPAATYDISIDESTSVFAKAGLVYENHPDPVDWNLLLLVGVGAKYFFNDNVSVNAEFELGEQFVHNTDTLVGVFVGLSVYLK